MKPSYEVVVPTLGKEMKAMLTGLVFHRPPALRLITARMPTERATLYLLETLRRLGTRVTVEMETAKGIAEARYQGATSSDVETLICLDDDVLVVGDLEALMEASHEAGFAVPIMRYPQNFIEPTLEGIEEVWEPVSFDDPRVVRTLDALGDEFARIYEIGSDQPTTFLNGSCFAVQRKRMVEHGHLSGFNGLGGEDTVLGSHLGEGRVVSGVYGYHIGHFTLQEWKYDRIGLKLLLRHPDLFYELAKER